VLCLEIREQEELKNKYIMAYKRGLPTFNKGIEPEVKRTTVQNPEGTTTYKTSWSSKIPTRSSSYKAPEAKQGTKTSYVAKRTTPAQTTSGEREITTFPNVKAVGMKTKEITANTDIKVPVKTRKERFESDKAEWKKKHPGEVWEDRYKDKKPVSNEREWKSGGSFKEKKAVKLCKTC